MRAVLREFGAGLALVPRGFAFWGRRPGLLALGLIPAAVVAVLIVAALVVLIAFLEPLTLALTGFAADWGAWRDGLRILLAIALVAAVLFLATRLFTIVTLAIGGPIYERIQGAADAACGSEPEDRSPGVGRAIRDALRLVLLSVLASVVVLVIGLVPVVGSIAAPIVGFLLTASGLALELTLPPFQRRGLDPRQRRAALSTRRARALGFGIVVQACFLVPLGAVIVMPAAVAGAALLVRSALGEPDRFLPRTTAGAAEVERSSEQSGDQRTDRA